MCGKETSSATGHTNGLTSDTAPSLSSAEPASGNKEDEAETPVANGEGEQENIPPQKEGELSFIHLQAKLAFIK